MRSGPGGPGGSRQPGPPDQRIRRSAVEAERGEEAAPIDEGQAESRADRHEPADDVGGRAGGGTLRAGQLEVERLADAIDPGELGEAATGSRVQVAEVHGLAAGSRDAEDPPIPAADGHLDAHGEAVEAALHAQLLVLVEGRQGRLGGHGLAVQHEQELAREHVVGVTHDDLGGLGRGDRRRGGEEAHGGAGRGRGRGRLGRAGLGLGRGRAAIATEGVRLTADDCEERRDDLDVRAVEEHDDVVTLVDPAATDGRAALDGVDHGGAELVDVGHAGLVGAGDDLAVLDGPARGIGVEELGPGLAGALGGLAQLQADVALAAHGGRRGVGGAGEAGEHGGHQDGGQAEGRDDAIEAGGHGVRAPLICAGALGWFLQGKYSRQRHE